MYFSENFSTLPDMAEVNSIFDRDYDQAEYEQKIARLAGAARASAQANGTEEFQAWKDAVDVLRKEDHYLLVLIARPTAKGRPRGDFLKLIATAVAIVALLLLIIFAINR